MKALILVVILAVFSVPAQGIVGVVVKVLPDTLVLDQSCKAIADVTAKELSIIYACKDDNNRMYFYNFRPNNIDLIADFKKNTTEVVVNRSQFGSYTLFEMTAKNSKNVSIKFVSYCTKETCLDLVSDNEYDKSVQDNITLQLRNR